MIFGNKRDRNPKSFCQKLTENYSEVFEYEEYKKITYKVMTLLLSKLVFKEEIEKVEIKRQHYIF